MPKRKREDEIEESVDRALAIRKSRLSAKISQGNKYLFSALKLARGFERQKLGRRQKTASRNNEGKKLLRLKEEVIALKSLDLAKTAESYLLKHLFKTKRVRESNAFLALFGSGEELQAIGTVKPGAEANVIGRLFNTNPVKEVMPGITKSIFGCLGLDEIESKEKKGNFIPMVSRTSMEPDTADDSFEGFSDDEQQASNRPPLPDPKNEFGDISNEDQFSDLDARIAPSASPEDSSDEEFLTQSRQIRNDRRHNREVLGHRSSPPRLSLTPDPSGDSSASLPQPKIPNGSASTSLQKKTNAPRQPTSKTTFLPSLMGGYYSGSESDGSIDDRVGALPKPRKNRRGQQARRLIAERKYGRHAKHLLKQQANGVAAGRGSRDAGWDAKRGATLKDDRSKGGEKHDSAGGRRQRVSGANEGPVIGGRPMRVDSGVTAKEKVAGKTSAVDGPLHPSWEAAKRRKEQGLGGGAVAFAGKKVVFD